MFHALLLLLRVPALQRRADVDRRSTVLALFARFTDEVGSGLLLVLMPSLRRRLGLSVPQVGWCYQAWSAAGALVEPLAGVAIDRSPRRPLLVAGAAGWGLALVLAAGAPSFPWLLLAFGLAGAAYGPLTTTSDVVLVESHPDDVERIGSRSAAIDTLGALLAPTSVAVATWAGADEAWVLVGAGVATLAYAALLLTSRPPGPRQRTLESSIHAVVADARAVITDRRARPWLVALLLLEVMDLPEMFEPVWLRDVVGASQPLVAAHVAIGLVASLAATVALDRWLATHDAGPVLVVCAVASLAIWPAWLLAPGVAAKLALVVPRNVLMAPLWPVVRARALATAHERAGTLSAMVGTVGLLPLAAGFGWVADVVGLTPALLAVQVLALLALLAVLHHAPDAGRRAGA